MKPAYTIIFLMGTLALASCGTLSTPKESTFQRTPEIGTLTVSNSSLVACPSQDFVRFVDAFVGSIAVQKAFVADPVQSESIDTNAQPEPKPIVKNMRVSQLSFPLIPSTQQQASEKLQMTLITSSSDEATAQLTKEDIDYQLTFFFRRQDGCWKLYRLINDSL